MNVIRIAKSDSVMWDQLVIKAVEHVNKTEEYLSNICQRFGSYSRKAAKSRNACDGLALALYEYAGSNSVSDNKSLKPCLQHLADSMATLGDLGDNHLIVLACDVIEKLSQFGPICRSCKSDIKKIEKLTQRSSAKKKSTLKKKIGDSHESSNIAEDDIDRNCLSESIEELLGNFEKNKVNKLKDILNDFTRSELNYHCKAIEVLTEASKSIEELNDYDDLEDFKSNNKITNKSDFAQGTDCAHSLENKASRLTLGSPQGPGTYHHHTVIGGIEDDSSLECLTDFSQSQN